MKPTIALFVADPFCSVQSANGIITALGNDYTFKLFSKNEVEDGFFDSVDMVVVPGSNQIKIVLKSLLPKAENI
jgi:hypothetical protein